MIGNEKLLTLIHRAEANGFDLRRWYLNHIGPEWPGDGKAVSILATEGRIFALIFSHDFARAFWNRGTQMQFVVPAATYSRVNGHGEVVTITRKRFSRRTLKPDVWQYHLRQMVVSDDPVAYLGRFLPEEPWNCAQMSGFGARTAAG
jgi:hypothetical protein